MHEFTTDQSSRELEFFGMHPDSGCPDNTFGIFQATSEVVPESVLFRRDLSSGIVLSGIVKVIRMSFEYRFVFYGLFLLYFWSNMKRRSHRALWFAFKYNVSPLLKHLLAIIIGVACLTAIVVLAFVLRRKVS